MRNVLMISGLWPPTGGSGIQRVVKFAKYLPKFGWNPVILTTNHVRDVRRPSVVDEELESDIDGIVSHRLPSGKGSLQHLARAFSGSTLSSPVNERLEGDSETYERLKWVERLLLFPDNMALWRIPSLLWLLTNCKDYDIDCIWSSSGPETAHIIGLDAKRIMKVPWVADFRDLWVDDPYKMFPTRMHKMAAETVEKSIVHQADAVTVVGEEMKRILTVKYAIDGKTTVIRNGFDNEDYLQPASSGNAVGGTRAPLEPASGAMNSISLIYMGTMHDFYAPVWETLLLASSHLRADGYPVTIEVVGQVTPRLRQRGDEILGRNCIFHGYLPHSQALGVLSKGDTAILLLDRREGSSQTVTGKVYELLASGLPILCIAPECSEGVRLVLEHRRGMVCEPESDVHAVIDTLLKLLCYPRLQVSDAVQRFAGYSRKVQTAQLAGILDSVTEQADSGS